MGGIGEGGGSWTTAGKIHRSLQAGGPSRVYVTNFTRNKAAYLNNKSFPHCSNFIKKIINRFEIIDIF